MNMKIQKDYDVVDDERRKLVESNDKVVNSWYLLVIFSGNKTNCNQVYE